MAQNIRWQQRFYNYQKALGKLNEAVNKYSATKDEIIKEGIIQRFEFTHELAWKVLKDYLLFEGIQNITGSRSATKQAFNIGLIRKGQIWLDMIESRNKTVHTYNEAILEAEFNNIIERYSPLLNELEVEMEKKL
ncbi:MAG: nucleotidyltransferase substrate binding protein [Bacteroidales bacterium]